MAKRSNGLSSWNSVSPFVLSFDAEQALATQTLQTQFQLQEEDETVNEPMLVQEYGLRTDSSLGYPSYQVQWESLMSGTKQPTQTHMEFHMVKYESFGYR